METLTRHHLLDASFKFRTASADEVPVRATDLALIITSTEIVECRLTFEVSYSLYQYINEKAIFNLYREVRNVSVEEEFAPDTPIEIEAKLDNELLQELFAKVSDPEQIADHLLKLMQTDPSNILLFADSWYGLYVQQAVSLPPELTGKGLLKKGYRTSWADGGESNQEKRVVITNENKDLKSLTANGQMLQVMTNFFTKNGHPVYEWEGETVFSLPYKGTNGEWLCYAEAREEENLCCFYSICPLKAPQQKRGAIAEFISRVNYTLTVGNLEMDFSDGEIRYRTSIDVEGDRLSTPLFRQLTIANVTMMDRYLPGIKAIINNDLSPEDALAQIEG